MSTRRLASRTLKANPHDAQKAAQMDRNYTLRLLDTLDNPSLLNSTQLIKPISWQENLLSLADAVDRMTLNRGQPQALMVLNTTVTRFPRIMGSISDAHQFVKNHTNLAPAILQVYYQTLSSWYGGGPGSITPAVLPGCESIIEMSYMCWLLGSADPHASKGYLSTSESCADILSMFRRGLLETIPGLVEEKVGALAAANLVVKIFFQSFSNIHTLSHVVVLAGHLLSIPGYPAYLLGHQVHIRTIQIFWECLPLPIPEGYLTAYGFEPVVSVIQCVMSLLHRQYLQLDLQVGPAAARIAQPIIQLIETLDWLSLGAIAFLFSGASQRDQIGNEDILYQAVGDFGLTITTAVAAEPSIIEPHIMSYLLRYMDCFRDLAEGLPYRQHVIDAWTKIIVSCGTTEATLRRQEKAQAQLTNGGLTGCSWYQCIFHGGEPSGCRTRTMLLDGACMKVQYCSLFCQKSDWYQGLHKKNCNTGSQS